MWKLSAVQYLHVAAVKFYLINEDKRKRVLPVCHSETCQHIGTFGGWVGGWVGVKWVASHPLPFNHSYTSSTIKIFLVILLLHLKGARSKTHIPHGPSVPKPIPNFVMLNDDNRN